MARFTIIRIYEVPANNRYAATDELMKAIELHQEKAYHVTDIVRESGEKRGKPINRSAGQTSRQPASMITIFKRQLTGKW
jgi:hypothetical protein